MVSVSQFDDLGRVYEEMFKLPWRRHLEVPTVFGLLGDLAGRAVLDIGSGSGWYCKRLAEHGAREVVGLDVSSGMVDYARRHNSCSQITYLLGELPAEMRGRFDIALSVYVFPYARTREELHGLCRTAAASLLPGGRFLALVLNPDYRDDPEYYAPYGFRIRSPSPRSDSAQATLELRFAEHSGTVSITYWTRESLAGAFRSAGFSDPAYRDYQLAQQGIDQYGRQFWQDYLDRPHAIILDCRLSGTQ
jgi:toxoflavin synthase